MRYEMTKAEAEEWLELLDKAAAAGFTGQWFSFGDGKYYRRELLEEIRDNGGISIGEEEPLPEPHTVVVPASVFGLVFGLLKIGTLELQRQYFENKVQQHRLHINILK